MRLALLAVLLAACHHGASGPPSPACPAVADHIYGMLAQDDHGKHVRDAIATRCAKDGWPAPARTCMLDTRTLHDGHHCKDRLTPEQHSALDADLQAIEKKRATELPPECERYRLLMVKVATCDKLPQASRDGLQQGYQAMARGWARFAEEPADGRRRMIEGCKQGVEAMEQVGKLCGW